MPGRRVFTVVGCHAGGEVGNVVVGGVLPPPGETVFEQMQALRADDSLRRLLLREPRGSVAVHANLVVPSRRPDCARRLHHHGADRVPAHVRARTRSASRPCCSRRGWWRCRSRRRRSASRRRRAWSRSRARCSGGKCESVELTNVPCFADRLDAPLEVEGLGTLTVDVAYGGMWYAIADAAALGFALEPSEAADLSRAGEAIRAAAREQVPCVHPENPDIAGVSIVQIAEPWQGVGAVSRNAVVVSPGRLDRSATGTGPERPDGRAARARAAARRRRMSHASVIGSTFEGRVVSETTVGGTPGDRARDPRQRLDHRSGSSGRAERPVPRGLRAHGHVARRRPELAVATLDGDALPGSRSPARPRAGGGSLAASRAVRPVSR